MMCTCHVGTAVSSRKEDKIQNMLSCVMTLLRLGSLSMRGDGHGHDDDGGGGGDVMSRSMIGPR